MARMARLVVPSFPHHVTQRGARRQPTFFGVDDYRLYLYLLAEAKVAAGITVWAYCLMPNHVHIVAVPRDEHSLQRLFGEAHRRYTRAVNEREGWRGHLWQERFHSCVMDERHLIAAVRYVEFNPVRAGLCGHPGEWPWSSARAHLDGRDDALVDVRPMLERIPLWADYLATEGELGIVDSIRRNTRSGCPPKDPAFLRRIEALTGRTLHRSRASCGFNSGRADAEEAGA